MVIADELEKRYIRNLQDSYQPRSLQGISAAENYSVKKSTYTNKHKVEEAVHAVIKDTVIEIELDESITYDDPRNISAAKVHDWLSKGTKGDSRKKGKKRTAMSGFYKDENDHWHYNYPTPAHPFKEHTANEMKVFLETLRANVKNDKYSTYRYTGKKKRRKHYKGVEVAPREE